MKTIKDKLLDPVYLAYLSLLAISLIIFCLTNTFTTRQTEGTFLIHYVMAAVPLVLTFTVLRKRREGLLSMVLLLFTISCFALNREFELFDKSTPWFSAVVVATSVNLLVFRFYEHLPRPLQWLAACIMGLALVMYTYLSLYLLPWYPVSVPGLIALGLSVHTFIPVWLLVHASLLAYKRITSLPARLALCMGIAVPLAVVITFAWQFNTETHRLNRSFHRLQVSGDDQLPAWVKAAQQAGDGLVTDRVLKGGLVYRAPVEMEQVFNLPSRRINQPRIHDPLVTTGLYFSPLLDLDDESRIRILETLHDARHETQERLWTGDDLQTAYVNTKVQIWPKRRLAYTEKMISVRNIGARTPEEAIYTFQLPEGGVVTSLSLWINGKEEKSILTTREKADSAYRAIVGVERRDPALIRWQEGNTVSVRVFPVPPLGSRQFKIGFTAPLAASGQLLHYGNCWFNGPGARLAPQDVAVEFMTPPVNPVIPANFHRTGNSLTAEGDYQPGWQLAFANEGIDSSGFSFNGYEYTMQPYTPKRVPAVTEAVYLDVNAAWTPEECAAAIRNAGNIPAYVWLNDQMVPATRDNLEPLLHQKFSLFPVHRITNPATALLITKSNGLGPHLSELQGSGFVQSLNAWRALPGQPRVRLLNLGAELSPYLKTLKEQRVFRYEKGGLLLEKVLLDSKSFAEDIETASKVVIDEAAVTIEKKPASSAAGPAPDHLMRLFAYNHIMQQKGRGAMPDSLVALAQEAYVVTPLTSLVVLETQKDYDRFGIKDTGNSLKNASAKSKGAVPEPHEWALIVLAILTLLYVKFRNKWKGSAA